MIHQSPTDKNKPNQRGTKTKIANPVSTQKKQNDYLRLRFHRPLKEMLHIKKSRINLGRSLVPKPQNIYLSRFRSTSRRFIHLNLLKQLRQKKINKQISTTPPNRPKSQVQLLFNYKNHHITCFRQ